MLCLQVPGDVPADVGIEVGVSLIPVFRADLLGDRQGSGVREQVYQPVMGEGNSTVESNQHWKIENCVLLSSLREHISGPLQ